MPKHIVAVSDIPYTRSGKKVELAVARFSTARPVPRPDVANPEARQHPGNPAGAGLLVQARIAGASGDGRMRTINGLQTMCQVASIIG